MSAGSSKTIFPPVPPSVAKIAKKRNKREPVRLMTPVVSDKELAVESSVDDEPAIPQPLFKTRRISVLKKRIVHLNPIQSLKPIPDETRAKPKEVKFLLSEPVSVPRESRNSEGWLATTQPTAVREKLLVQSDPLTLCSVADHKPSAVPFIERLEAEHTPLFLQELEAKFKRELHSLDNFEKVKRMQVRMENYIMGQTGKKRQSLLLRKKQLLPKIGPSGEECSILALQRTVTPPKLTVAEFFAHPRVNAERKNGICRVVSRQERGYKSRTEWVGCPVATDPMLAILKGMADERDDTWDGPDRIKKGVRFKDLFLPEIASLSVVGSNIRKLPRYPFKSLPLKKKYPKETIYPVRYRLERDRQSFSVVSMESYNVSDTDLNVDNSRIPGIYFKDTWLVWKNGKERSKENHVIDVGCVAELGSHGVSSVIMTNTGPTVIYFHWIRLDSTDMCSSPELSEKRFVFDACGGVLLPNETYRVPFLYQAITMGFYSEDWRLLTRPVLENGASIVLRITGFTKPFDHNGRRRLDIDEVIQRSMTENFIRQILNEIIHVLPVQDDNLREEKCQIDIKGKDLFEFLNPGFKYNSASAYRIGKLLAIMEEKIPVGVMLSLDEILLQDKSFIKEAEEDEDSNDLPSGSNLSTTSNSKLSLADVKESVLIKVHKLLGKTRIDEALAALLADLISPDLPSLKLRPEGDEEDSKADTKEETKEDKKEDVKKKSASGFKSSGSITKAAPASEKTSERPSLIQPKMSFNRESVSDTALLEQYREKNSLTMMPLSRRPTDEGRRASPQMLRITEISETLAVWPAKRLVIAKAPVNLAKTDVLVDDIRGVCLENLKDFDEQTVYFNVFANEVSKLFFRPQEPIQHNMRQEVSRMLFCQLLDEFYDFEQFVKGKSFFGSKIEEEALSSTRLSLANSQDSVLDNYLPFSTGVEEEEVASRRLTEKRSEWTENVDKFSLRKTKVVLPSERLKHQYHALLEAQMLHLLTDYLDKLGMLFCGPLLEQDSDKLPETFIKVKQIGMNKRIEDMLETPTAPQWINIAKRMARIASKSADND